MTDRKEEQQNKKHSLATKIILVVVILLIMSFGVRCAVDYHNKKTVQEMEKYITEFEENMNAITEIENAMKQEAVNNHDSIIFEIIDEDGESIYKSKKIAPGYEMNCIELDKELSKGRHECTIEIQYAVEGHVATVFPLVIDVE